jgi:hypothetical protein
LPLPALIAALLAMRSQSQQVMLDSFFAGLAGGASLVRGVSDRAFAKARSRLHMPALESLNHWLVDHAESAGRIARWRGLRVVAGDASVLMPAVRPCLRLRAGAASPDQRLFMLFLPGAELTLHAAVHDAGMSERAMLVEALDALGPDDVLVLDRGYPASWVVALLNERGIRFCIRCDNARSWSALDAFRRSGAEDAVVTLSPPSASDARGWGCSTQAPTVRLVRQIAPNGQFRILATNLPAADFPAPCFGDLYHQRWRIEEAFKRLKHRLHLESVSGLSQQALIIDVAAKVLADNLAALICAAAADAADLQTRSRRCNRSYAACAVQRAIPRLILGLADIAEGIGELLRSLSANTQRFVPGRSRPRPGMNHRVKPHPSIAYRG